MYFLYSFVYIYLYINTTNLYISTLKIGKTLNLNKYFRSISAYLNMKEVKFTRIMSVVSIFFAIKGNSTARK